MSIRCFHWISIAILLSLLISGCNPTAPLTVPTIEPTRQPTRIPTVTLKPTPSPEPTTTATPQKKSEIQSVPIKFESVAFNQTDWSLIPIELPNNGWVYDIATVPEGSTWFTSTAGVWRYDGREWRTDPSPPGGLCFSVTSNVKAGLVVAACVGGLYRWSGENWAPFSTQAPEILKQIMGIGLHIQDDGSLWMGVVNPEMGYLPGFGAIHFDGQQWQVYSAVNFEFEGMKTETTTIPFTDVVNIVSGLQEEIWFLTNVGVSSFDGDTWQDYTFSDLTGRELVQDENAVHKISGLNGMVAATDGTVWVGTQDGAAHFDGSSWTLYTLDAQAEAAGIYPLAAAADGSVWFWFPTQLLHFDGSAWLSYPVPPEFGDPFTAAVGSKQELWLANDKMIARYLPGGAPVPIRIPTPFTTSTPPVAVTTGTGRTEYLVGENISTVTFDPGGQPWALTREGGKDLVKVLESDAWVTYTSDNSGIPADSLMCLVVDQDGNAWIGTYKSGLVKFDGKNWTTFTTQSSGLLKDTIGSLFVDRKGRLWVKYSYQPDAASSGVTVFDGTTWTSYTTANSGLLSNEVITIAFDAENRTWFGTDSGLSIFDGSQWTTYPASTIGMEDGVVWSIAFDKEGLIWVGFSGQNQGITVFDGKNWKYLPPEEMGFTWHKNRQNDILIDQMGRIWVRAYQEVRIFDGANWISLTDIDPSLSNVNAITMDEQGNIWIANGDYRGLVKLARDYPFSPAK